MGQRTRWPEAAASVCACAYKRQIGLCRGDHQVRVLGGRAFVPFHIPPTAGLSLPQASRIGDAPAAIACLAHVACAALSPVALSPRAAATASTALVWCGHGLVAAVTRGGRGARRPQHAKWGCRGGLPPQWGLGGGSPVADSGREVVPIHRGRRPRIGCNNGGDRGGRGGQRRRCLVPTRRHAAARPPRAGYGGVGALF